MLPMEIFTMLVLIARAHLIEEHGNLIRMVKQFSALGSLKVMERRGVS